MLSYTDQDLREDALKLTPVQNVGGYLFKRDDLFQPAGFTMNGGKLRQAILQITGQPGMNIVSGSQIISPQSPIIAQVCEALSRRCVIVYGCEQKTVRSSYEGQLAISSGAEIVLSPSGRQTVIRSICKDISARLGHFHLDYGMNSESNIEAFYQANARQVENIPDKLDNLVITCGSGITATGVIKGILDYGKKVDKIYLVGVAPNRIEKVKMRLKKLGSERKFIYIDLFQSPKFAYEKTYDVFYRGIRLHERYEAKAFLWFKDKFYPKGEIHANSRSLFWITGGSYAKSW